MIKSKTFHSKRNNFSELHYGLPGHYSMFDIDLLHGKWLDIDIKSTKEEATYIEYRCLKHDNNRNKFNLDRFKPVALFELKHKGSEAVKKQFIELKEGTATWAEFMFCKLTGMRFFFVVATKGKAPYHFIEIATDTGKYKHVGTLEEDTKECVTLFWDNVLKL